MRTLLTAIAFTALLQLGLASETASAPTELTPQEKEMAHKMWLFTQALPHQDIVNGQIAPRLLALGNSFQCPTPEELEKGITKSGEFAKNGIYFQAIPEHVPALQHGGKFEFIHTLGQISEGQIVQITCVYMLHTPEKEKSDQVNMKVDFVKSGIDNSIVVSNGLKSYSPFFMTREHIEFKVIPFQKLLQK